MMQRTNSAERSGIVTRDRVIDVVRTCLRNAIVVQRLYTAEQIAEMSGVPRRTILSYMANDPGEAREPTLSNALSIACVLGQGPVNSVLALIGYGGAVPLDEADDEMAPGAVVAGLVEQLHKFASAASDGRFYHIERPILRKASDEILTIVTPFSSVGAAA
jgi:hypothetical protein